MTFLSRLFLGHERRKRTFTVLEGRPARCLILQSDGEHKGQDGWTPNWYLRECYALQHAFRENGIETDIWGLRHENFTLSPDLESYDIVFCAENYELGWLPKLSKVRRPLMIQWIIDLHFRGPRAYRRVSRSCDVVLHSTRRLMDGYRRLNPRQRHLWFPNAVDDRHFDAAKHGGERIRDIIFVGSDLPQRRELIRELRAAVGLESFFATGEDMIELIASARIHLNKNIGSDINFRTFETIGLGTCLLTNEDADLATLGFEDGVNCLTYASAEEAASKVRRALMDESWREIGEHGYALSRRHTYVRRVRDLLAELNPPGASREGSVNSILGQRSECGSGG